MSGSFEFERVQEGMYRVKDATGYIGVVTGKSYKWLAETTGGVYLSTHKTRSDAATALSKQRLL